MWRIARCLLRFLDQSTICFGYEGLVVVLIVHNSKAVALTRKFARIAGVGIAEAIVIAIKEAIERRRETETPLETAIRLREKHGITLRPTARKPLPREVFDEM